MKLFSKSSFVGCLFGLLVPSLTIAAPERVPSFGPNGSHWPELLPTPFMYDPSVANIIDVDCTWTAIRNAITSVTPEMADAGVLIRVAPGALPGNGSGASSTPVIQNVGSASWTKRVTVAPRDGYGTVTIGVVNTMGARIHNVSNVCFAGFVAHAIRPSACNNSAIAWTKVTFWLGVSASTNLNSSNMELVEVVLPEFSVRDTDAAESATSTNGANSNFQFIGCYIAPRYRSNGSAHTDTLQFFGNSAYSNMVFRDSALFSSSNCAIQTGAINGLLIENCYLASRAPALSRYPFPTGYTPPNPQDVTKTLNGAGSNIRIRDSIFIGGMPGYTTTQVVEVTNSRVNQASPGTWTLDPSLLDSTPEDFNVPLPTDEYLESIWQPSEKLLASALGGNVSTGSQAHLPSVEYSAGAASLTFQRASADYVYSVEASSDLLDWTTFATNPGSVGENVTVTTTPPAGAPRHFLRLAVANGARVERSQSDGYLAIALPAGVSTTYFGQPLISPSIFRGNVTAVAAAQLTFAGAAFADGAFTASPHWARIATGPQAGRVALITANTTSTVTVDLLDGSAQNVALNAAGWSMTVGNTVEIVPADTLGSLFGGLLTPGNSLFAADTVSLWNGTRWVAYYRSTTQNAWLGQLTGNTPQDTLVVAPHQAWVLTRRAGRPATTLVQPGVVPETRQLLRHTGAGTVMTGARIPIAQTLASFAFSGPGVWTSNDNAASADTISLWNGTQWIAYWRTATGEWRRQGDVANTDQSALVIDAGRVVSVLRRSATTGTGSFLSQPLPYFDSRQ